MNKYFNLSIVLPGLLFGLLFPSSALWAQGFSDLINGSYHDGDDIVDRFGTGAAWIDFNKDGRLDLYLTKRNGPNHLYQNNASNFTDVAAAVGATGGDSDGDGVVIADYDRDGWNDIFLANCNEDKLLRNLNGLAFEDVSAIALPGPDYIPGHTGKSTSASWGDYDNDGYLDLYVAHHNPVNLGPVLNGDFQDHLYHNNGDGTFTDVSIILEPLLNVADSNNLTGPGFIAGWTDIDFDMDLDIVLINDCHYANINIYNKVFRNDGGTDPFNWNFTEVSAELGLDKCDSGMGMAIGDYNRNGWMDIAWTDLGPPSLYQNMGNNSFQDVSNAAGVEVFGPGGQLNLTWGCSFVDYDLDGWQDLIVAAGALGNFNPLQPSLLFHNNGDDTFTEVGAALNMDDDTRGRSCVYGDFDNDGDPDFIFVNYGQPYSIKRNNINNGNHWLRVGLIGTLSNTNGIGAKMRIKTGAGEFQHFETRSGSNLGGGDDLDAYFGLGSATVIQQLIIIWPSGIWQRIYNIPADQRLEITEPIPPPGLAIHMHELELNYSGNSLSGSPEEIVSDAFNATRIDGEQSGLVNGKNGVAPLNTAYSFERVRPYTLRAYYKRTQEKELITVAGALESAPTLEAVLYPNPVTHKTVQLRYRKTDPFILLEIYDLQGVLVRQMQLDDQAEGEGFVNISTDGMPNGNYLVRLAGESMEKTLKLLITR